MTDLRKTIEPKSDQLNADDLIACTKTIKITGVQVNTGEQSVSISYEGDEGKPYKPCKSMRRVLVMGWGVDGDDYIGRSLTLYNDVTVKWAGTEVGGIRISHMSHIEKAKRMMLTVTRGKRVPYVVEPLESKKLNNLSDDDFNAHKVAIENCADMPQLSKIAKTIKAASYDKQGSDRLKEVYAEQSSKIRGV